MEKKIFVIGTGFLGSNLVEYMKKNNYEFFNTYFSTNLKQENLLDIQNLDEIKACLTKFEPDIVINSAGRNDIDYLEKNPIDALNVNTLGAKNIATAANELGIKLIHISTDSIFDGLTGNYNENDVPNPVNVYAKSKYDAETAIQQITKNHVIIRTNFYGKNNNSKYLFNVILNKLKNKEKFIGFNDVIFSPLEINNLSQLIFDVINSNFLGIIHLASNEEISKYEFCTTIADTLNFDKSLIVKDSIEKQKFIAKRPRNTSLNNLKSKSIIKHDIISFKDWILTINEEEIK